MAVREILLLGNPLLYQPCEPVAARNSTDCSRSSTISATPCSIFAAATAAEGDCRPQIGVMKRLIYWHSDPPQALVNPILENLSSEMFTLWDDCMSFPDLLVRVAATAPAPCGSPTYPATRLLANLRTIWRIAAA